MTTHRFAVALTAVALTACAHAHTSSSSGPTYLGGRAGQPGGWSASPETVAVEGARHQAWNDPLHGGRSAQPASWIVSDPAPTNAAPAYCYAGGRDAQPSSGPQLMLSQ
ncbi:MAG TPA: hypothetical protein VFZ61_22755, partial [Polyangiales bacterium]